MSHRILHTENLHDRADVMPPINAVFFSASGTRCATCIPTLAEGRITHQYPDGGDTEEKSYQVGNDLILRARFVPTLTGVTLESVTQENQTQQTSTYQTDYSKTGPADRDYGDWAFSSDSSESASSRAILAIDYVGDQEVTFKENCPDLRNTRVIDLIQELREYGARVDVHDPWADPDEARDEYGLDLIQPRTGHYRAIVLAVAHRQFREQGITALRAFGQAGAVFYYPGR